jgi:hypothetical protein
MIVPLTAQQTMTLLGPNFISTFQSEMDAIMAPLRKHIALGRPLSMGKELWEYVVADSIPGAVWNGAGHSLIDVMLTPGVGADVKSLSFGTGAKHTTEASMYQNFDQDAEQFFINRDKQSLWNLYINGWFTKVHSFKKYYLIGILREKETLNCNMCAFEVTDSIPAFVDSNCTFTKKMMHVLGIANQDFLKIRYYNSKSRLEILFQEKCWKDSTYTVPIYIF